MDSENNEEKFIKLERFMEPVMTEEININTIGTVKIWEIIAILLAVFFCIRKF